MNSFKYCEYPGAYHQLNYCKHVSGIFSLAALAIAVEALLLSNPPSPAAKARNDLIYKYTGLRLRNKRSAADIDPLTDFEPIFSSIEAADKSDCGKLLVCNAMCKRPQDLTRPGYFLCICVNCLLKPHIFAHENWTLSLSARRFSSYNLFLDGKIQ